MKKKTITAEDCYRLFHKYTNLIGSNRRVRAIKNFENAKSKPAWIEFEKFAFKCTRLNGALDPEFMIELLAKDAEGFFSPKLLNTQRSIQKYKLAVQVKESKETIPEAIQRSLSYIKSLGIGWEAYLNSGLYAIPKIIKDKMAGKISPYLIYIDPSIIGHMKSTYPQDTYIEFCKSLEEDYDSMVAKINAETDPKFKFVKNNIKKILNRI